jgi:hypothetical protein
MMFTGYAYWVNAIQATNGTAKKVYHFYAIFLAPIWPLLVIGWVLLFLLRALAYGIFLILFTVAVVLIRKPLILIWLGKVALKIGNKLLSTNEFLIGLFFPKLKQERM